MSVVSRTVMEAGRAAKLARLPDSENPHPAGSQNSADWLEGYTFDEPEQNTNDAESDA